MAQQLPNVLRLREIKYASRTSREERIRVARRLLEAERLAEALDLFLIAEDDKGIAEMKERALEEGRPVLLKMLARAGRKTSAAEWKRAAEAAFADGRFREAYFAFDQAGDADGLSRVQEKMPNYELFKPAGK